MKELMTNNAQILVYHNDHGMALSKRKTYLHI